MRSKKGFTLVEVLVAMFIFTIAMVAISEIFVSFIRSYRTARVMQKDLQDAQQASNYISKTLRTSTVMSGSDEEGGKEITIYDYSQGLCIKYSFASDGLFMKIAPPDPAEAEKEPIGDEACDETVFASSESNKLIDGEVIQDGKFVRSISSGFGDATEGTTAKVGIVTVMISLKTGHGAPLNIQTSASLRDYEKTVNPDDLGGSEIEQGSPEIDTFEIACPISDGDGYTVTKIEAHDNGWKDLKASELNGFKLVSSKGLTPDQFNDFILEASKDADGWEIDKDKLVGHEFQVAEEGDVTITLIVRDKVNNTSSESALTDSDNHITCKFTKADTEAPTVESFSIPENVVNIDNSIGSKKEINGIKIVADDGTGKGVAACKVTRYDNPDPKLIGWSPDCNSVSYECEGCEYDTEYTLYPWAKDLAGNISAKSAFTETVKFEELDKIKPVVKAFEVSSPTYSMEVKIDKIVASDEGSGVAWYCIKEGAVADTRISNSDCTWRAWPKDADEITYSEDNKILYNATTEGAKTLFVWVKDGNGNISEITDNSKKAIAVWNYIPGPCGAVRMSTTGVAPWSSGTFDDSHCSSPYCTGDPGVLSSNNEVAFASQTCYWWGGCTTTGYNARQQCKDTGGRLPTRAEMQCIQRSQGIYGALGGWTYFWTSEEVKTTNGCFLGICLYDYSKAYSVNGYNGGVDSTAKTTLQSFKCVH